MSEDRVSLTDEQRGPLLMRRASVALAAGAGCGKTTVLTERFLSEIDGDEGRALRSLAVMTFTEKAARELRQRLFLGLARSLAADPERYHLLFPHAAEPPAAVIARLKKDEPK